MKTIAVTGATGIIGRRVIDALAADQDVRITATTRHPGAPRGLGERVRFVSFDWESPDGLEAVVDTADALLVIPPSARHPLPTTARLLDAAAAADVRHVVFISTFGADFDPGFAFGRSALAAERAVAGGSVPWTVLRPNSYLTNFFGMARPGPDGALRLPWGAGRCSFVDPRDVAEVAARVLNAPDDHMGATYELTGPEALDAHAIASALAQASGAPIHYVDTPLAAVEARMTGAGLPPQAVGGLLELHAVMASGARARVTDDVRRITGRPPRSLAEFARDHAEAWAARPAVGAGEPVGHR